MMKSQHGASIYFRKSMVKMKISVGEVNSDATAMPNSNTERTVHTHLSFGQIQPFSLPEPANPTVMLWPKLFAEIPMINYFVFIPEDFIYIQLQQLYHFRSIQKTCFPSLMALSSFPFFVTWSTCRRCFPSLATPWSSFALFLLVHTLPDALLCWVVTKAEMLQMRRWNSINANLGEAKHSTRECRWISRNLASHVILSF